MRWIQFVQSSLLLLCSASVCAGPWSLKAGYPERYTVKAGDTLWDIANQYLSQPWLWPNLWHHNRHIGHPDWIYPGDVLQIVWQNGEPLLTRLGGEVPSSSATATRAPINTLPSGPLQPFLTHGQILNPTYAARLPYILASSEGHYAQLAGDIVYVQGWLQPNQRYGIYHLGQIYHEQGANQREIGQEARQVGTLQTIAQLPDGRSKALLIANLREVRQGDKVMALAPQRPWPAAFLLQPASAAIAGHIIALYNQASFVGKGDVVLINQGQRQGLHAGHLLKISRPVQTFIGQQGRSTETVFSPLHTRELARRQQILYVAGEPIGQLMLFKVFDELSYGLVTDSSQMVKVGDGVEGFSFDER